MKLIVLGGCGAWPAAGEACSGYLVAHDGFQLLIDPGYAILPRLLKRDRAGAVDAVLVTHGHPDHCADLNPLLRARRYENPRPSALPVHSPPGAVDAVIALDSPATIDGTYDLRPFTPGDDLQIGPFEVATTPLPHWLPNAGVRLSAGGHSLTYTGDTGPSPAIAELARDTDLLLADATYAEARPAGSEALISTATEAGEHAARAGAARLVLTHLWPDTDPALAIQAARRAYAAPIDVATEGFEVDLG